jgi:hypothetical protein
LRHGKIIVFKIVLAVIVMLPLAILWLAGPLVWTALRTGKLLGRGAIYDRSNQAMYHFGVAFWFLLFSLLSFVSVGLLTHWPSS